ncbi:BrnT family toxin [Saccharomonospora halophila]|uniref:BrnT family toxin n=1 Tax=Saccharomonospora halophila TaxID=129922 RepID=UPI0003717005|nr:BrnT family toxin [Saccharomonospora halophila]
MEFEFDADKSRSNREEHGIDFGSAQRLWDDPMRVEVAARIVDEPRWLVVGLIDGKCWSAVVTYREQRIRIISVRRSRDEEVALYES